MSKAKSTTTNNSDSAANTSATPKNAAARRRINTERVQNALLIWLDDTIDNDSEDCQNTVKQLQGVVSNVSIFTDADACVAYIQSLHKNKACMIVSGSLGQQIVPRVHNISQVDSICIFSDNMESHEQWVKDWPKIKGVFTDIVPTCEALKQTAQQIEQNATPISFVAVGKRADQLDPSFMYTQLIKEIILTIHFDDTHRQQYVKYCRQIYADDEEQTEHINRLEREYEKGTPIGWYTCHCFLYPMLNRALRTMEGDIITEMGFFIKDLHQDIERLHKKQFDGLTPTKDFKLYRGQGLSNADFAQLQQSKGGLISFNSFLSTSDNRETSLDFAHHADCDVDQVGILFVMTICPAQSTTPFASVVDISNYPEEGEVLFSMQAVFRIEGIQELSDSNSLHEVHLTLTSDNDAELSKLTHLIREESYPKKDPWYRLGVVLWKMGQPNKAEEIYRTLLRQTSDEMEKASINYQLGRVKDAQGDYKEAITLYEKSLAVYKKAASSDPLSLADLYNWMGRAYYSTGDYSEALKIHNKALTIRQQSLPAHHADLAKSYSNIGGVYDSMGDYKEALSYYEKDLAISQQSLPLNHPDLAASYNNIGNVYYNMGDSQKALSFYEKSLTIDQQSLPPNHPTVSHSYNNIGNAYYAMGDFHKALSFYEKSLTIRQQSLPPNHPNVSHSYNNVGSVYYSMGDYEKALSSHEKALTIREQSLSPNHPDVARSYSNIGNVYKNMEGYEKALSSHKKALAIRQQSLSPNHPDVAHSYNSIGIVYERMGDYEKALSFHEKALTIREQSLSPNHVHVACSYKNIGSVYENMEDYEKAHYYYERAVQIAELS